MGDPVSPVNPIFVISPSLLVMPTIGDRTYCNADHDGVSLLATTPPLSAGPTKQMPPTPPPRGAPSRPGTRQPTPFGEAVRPVRAAIPPTIVPGQVGDVRNRVIPEHVDKVPADFYLSSNEKAFKGHAQTSRNYTQTGSKPSTPYGSMRLFQDLRKDRFNPAGQPADSISGALAPDQDPSMLGCRPRPGGTSLIRKGTVRCPCALQL